MRISRAGSLIAVIPGLLIISFYYAEQLVQLERLDHNLYAWDAIGFWVVNADLAEHFHHGFIDGVATFGRSFHHIYNDMWAIPSAIAMAIWGNSRFCYTVSNSILLVIPSALLCLWLFGRPGRFSWSSVGALLLAYLALVAAPLPWEVSQFGETDPGLLFMAAVTTSLIIRTDIRKASRTRWLIIGAGLATMALSKRYDLFLVIGLLAVLFTEVAIDFCVDYYRNRSLTLRSLIATATGPFLCLCGLVIVYFLSFPLPLEVVGNNYAFAYAAYQAGTTPLDAILVNLGRVLGSYGIIQVALAVISFIAALFLPRVRRAAVYLFIPAGVALGDFSRIQSMEPHHQLLMYLALVVLPVYLGAQLLAAEFRSERYAGWALLFIAGVISCLSFSSVFSSAPPFGESLVQKAFPTNRVRPFQRHDYDALSALLSFVDRKVGQAPGEKPVQSVYVISSSAILSSSLLNTAEFQMNEKTSAGKYILVTHDVDLRDGFPVELITARMVLVTDPVQTMFPTEQKVITVPGREFLQNGSFAQAFVRDPEVFQLDQGVKVYAFERTRPSTPDEIAQLRAEVGVDAILKAKASPP